VVAKKGLSDISAELGLAVRTCFVFAFVLVFAIFFVPRNELPTLSRTNYVWLGVSGLTTAASWVFYYKAIKQGEVSTVALIDKGSFVVAVLLAWMILGEQITPRKLAGMMLIACGLLVVAKK
jgi:bacterial/archaeal transporter family protein